MTKMFTRVCIYIVIHANFLFSGSTLKIYGVSFFFFFNREVTKLYSTILNWVKPRYCSFVTPEPPCGATWPWRLFKAMTFTPFLDGVKFWSWILFWGEDLWKDDILTSLEFIDRSSVQTASSSELTVFTFYTGDVILCMRDFVFCVSALVSAGFWRSRLPCCFPALRWLDLLAVLAFLTGSKIVRWPRANKILALPPLIFCDFWPVVFVSEAWKAFYRQENVELCTIKFLPW